MVSPSRSKSWNSIKRRSGSSIFLPRTAIAAALAAGVIGGAIAQESTPNTFTDVSVPQLTVWNEVNRLTVLPGIDGYTGASARTQVYTSQAAKQAAEAAFQADPGGETTNIEDLLWEDSPAAVYFELDDGSGRAPGIQAVTDDLLFPTNNCIMASGERESADFPGTIIPKTCSDDESSSKRYFLEIRDADTPVDLVFDVGMKDIRYKGVKDPEDDGGEALEEFRQEFGIGRIYRVIQKVVNNSDERWVGINVELGHGIGDDFQRFNFAQDGVAFELREFVPREFFDGETGAPDIRVWNPERYSTFAPKLFDDGSRDRFDEGFLDAQAAGMFPPQDVAGSGDKTPYINSGTTALNDGTGRVGAITLNHFSMVDAQAAGIDIGAGVLGYLMSDSLAPIVVARYDEGDAEGESDAVEAWWDGVNWRYGLAGDFLGVNPFGVVSEDQLEEWAAKLLGIDPSQLGNPIRYASILADDLATQNMDFFIYVGEGILGDDGEPKYDNITLRVTAVSTASAGLGESLGNQKPAWIVGGENNAPDLATYMPDTGVPVALNDLATMFENDTTSPFYNAGDETLNLDILANDLLDGQMLADSGVDIDTITIILNVNGGAATVQGDDTVDFTPKGGFTGLASFTYTVTVSGGESNEATVAIRVNPYPDPEAPQAVNDSALTFKNTTVTIDVLANDVLPAGTPTVQILDAPLTGTAVVLSNRIVYVPANDFLGLDRFTYTVTSNGKVSNAALITVKVDEVPVIDDPATGDEPTTGSSSGGGTLFGCSYNPGAPFDPTLLMLALAALGGMAYRNRRREQKQ